MWTPTKWSGIPRLFVARVKAFLQGFPCAVISMQSAVPILLSNVDKLEKLLRAKKIDSLIR